MSKEREFVPADILRAFVCIVDKMLDGSEATNSGKNVDEVQDRCRELSGNDSVKAVSLCVGAGVDMLKQSRGIPVRSMDLKELQRIAQETVDDMDYTHPKELLSQCNEVFAPVEGSDDGLDDGSSEDSKKGSKRGAKKGTGKEPAKKRKRIQGSDEESDHGGSAGAGSLQEKNEKLEADLHDLRAEIRGHSETNEALRAQIRELNEKCAKQNLLLHMANEGTAASTPGNPAVFTVDNFCAVYRCVMDNAKLETNEKSTFKTGILKCHTMCEEMRKLFTSSPWAPAMDKTSGPKLRDLIVSTFQPIYKTLQTTPAYEALAESTKRSLSDTMAQKSAFKQDNLYRTVFLLEATMCLEELTKKGNGSKKGNGPKKGNGSKKGGKSNKDEEPQKNSKQIAEARRGLQGAQEAYKEFKEGKFPKKHAHTNGKSANGDGVVEVDADEE